jgi:hypothetical protein
MSTKTFLGGAGAGALLIGAIWGLMETLSTRPNIPVNLTETRNNKGVMDLICELNLDLDGQLALGITGAEPPRMAMAQIDFGKSSGWYQGRIAISESRGGNLSIQGNKLVVGRPAMFQRFGVMISREEFVIDRSTGAFSQSLTLNDGRNIVLIKGTCAQVIKPPF